MAHSYQQAFSVEFRSHGIAIRKFRRDPFNSWGDGIGFSSWLLRKLKLKFYIIWAAETQSARILLINTKDKLIAEKCGTIQRLIKAEKNQ
ncbi:MAG: hypothetical protein CMN54_10260 [SAR324 cluster bacterium]|uniref:Uncharacterized protein n=1 Tax=SAR324 cluster bacterium TaxID=2024889 RepID=A0A2D6YKT6_9DELT|nr:hypothetical protein [SAR324 cluster bacterium]